MVRAAKEEPSGFQDVNKPFYMRVDVILPFDLARANTLATVPETWKQNEMYSIFE